jgi:geranylgeranyl diphosphate synthase type I
MNRPGSSGQGRRRAKSLPQNPFQALLGTVQRDVEARLFGYLDAVVEDASRHGSEVTDMVDALRDLCRRGGKRLRPALVATGLRAVKENAPLDVALDAGMALELLQAYFLIHDDWMDQDAERRGGPTVHTHLAKLFRSADKGAASAILAGDYAVALATEVLSDLDVPAARAVKVFNCYAEMQRDAVAGQQLDVIARTRDIERTYRLKTASYTVKGPLSLGALLGGASPRVLSAIERYSLPAGVAFQLRDDIIGVFGDPALTGKPRGGDLKAGKYTLLVAVARSRAQGRDLAALDKVLGNRRASERQVEKAISILESCGARQNVEERISELRVEAESVLAERTITEEGRLLLLGALEALTLRQA